MNQKNASLLLLILIMPCLYFLAVTDQLFSHKPLGIVIQILATGLMIWARITFGMRSFHGAANTTSGGLVTNGPYKWLRNPIYAAIIYFIWAGVLSHLSIETIAAAIVISACLVGRFLLEEHYLKLTYPDYAEYAAKTKRIIPFLV